ncbi:MAG TPA: hypothetical protein VMH22_04020 [bacterium]|nr:hypothetical protein [bacterium]
MKIQHSLRAVVLAAGVAAMVVTSGCKQGPVSYDKFEQRTIKANLAVIDSARVLYDAQLAAGNIDAAAQQACAFLLTQPGVDTAKISLDSTVWAYFSSGLLAGTGKDERPASGLTDAGRQAANREPAVRAASGGEVSNLAHYFIPFDTELPGTWKAANALADIFQRRLGWESREMSSGSDADLETALNLIQYGNSVIYWSGHGLLIPSDGVESTCSPGLELGKPYDDDDLASAAAVQYVGYLNPGAGQERQVALFLRTRDHSWHLVVMPGFIRANGSFDASEATPAYNLCKTVVILSCCYSAYSYTSAPGYLMQAFLDVGADVVCGYTWEVHDGFSCDRDTTFLAAMADTCLAGEALKTIGGRVDPDTGIDGFHAVFTMVGDSTVMLQAVVQARKNGELYQALTGDEVFQSENTKVVSTLHAPGNFDMVDCVQVTFPGTSGGTFDVTSTDGASIVWSNYASNHFWYAEKKYQGVSGTIQIDTCSGGYVHGSFSGTLGWWNSNHDPTKDPPDDVITITEGRIKHTGKVDSGDAFGPSPRVAHRIPRTLH